MNRVLGSVVALAVTSAALTGSVGSPAQSLAPDTRAAAYTPTAGPIFANRTGAIFNRLKANVNAAPAGSTIRAATMTFSDTGISSALIAAARRGVYVKVAVAAKACAEPAVDALQREDARAGSRLVVRCTNHSGRGTSGTQHIKGMSFSRTGTASRVVVLTSSNFTKTAPTKQWNDAYQSVGWTTFYNFWNQVHAEIMNDRAISSPFRQFTEGASSAYATPQNPGQADPVLKRIAEIPVRGLEIHIAQSALVGPRGSAIASALIRKRRAGARITYVYANPTARVSDMASAGIRMKKVDPPADDEFLHHKFMIASWVNTSGSRVYRTWMGTEVWTEVAKGSDEMVLRLGSPKTYSRYRSQISYLLGL